MMRHAVHDEGNVGHGFQVFAAWRPELNTKAAGEANAHAICRLLASLSRARAVSTPTAIDEGGQLTVQAHENQDTSMLSVFSAANALIRLPPGEAALAPGAMVDVLLLDRFDTAV